MLLNINEQLQLNFLKKQITTLIAMPIYINYNYKLEIHIPTAIYCDPNGIPTLRRQIWKAHMILFQGKIWIGRLRFNLHVAITVEFSEKANHDFAYAYNYKL